MEILELGGLLAIKAHAVVQACGYTSVDGLSDHYCNYLDLVLRAVEEKFGDEIWWTSPEAVATRCLRLRERRPDRQRRVHG
jgi:hypothetical protein